MSAATDAKRVEDAPIAAPAIRVGPFATDLTADDLREWNYTDDPPTGKDARKLVTLIESGMVWVGIRAWHHERRYWMNGNEPERAKVLAWMDLPLPANKRWSHGQLIGKEL